MSESKLGNELLAQAGLARGAISGADREAVRSRIERLNVRIRRLKTVILTGAGLALVCAAVVAVTRNGPHANEGARHAITQVAVVGFLIGFYGGIFSLMWMVLSGFARRGLEVSSRLANMESLLAGVAGSLERIAQRLENVPGTGGK